MRHRALTLVALGLLAWLTGTSPSSAQVKRVPASLELTPAAREASQGAAVTVTVGLLNYKEDPVDAPQRVDVTIESDLLKRPLRLAIPAGSHSARTQIVFDRAGIAKLKASASGLADGYAVIAVRAGSRGARWERLVDELVARVQHFYPTLRAAESSSPCSTDASVPQRSGLWLEMLPPRVAARNGKWSARLVVAVVNERREPIAALDDIAVNLAPTVGVIDFERVVIPKGASTQEVRVTSKTSGCDTIYAWSPTVGGVPGTHVEYERSLPSKVIVSPSAPEAVANGWTRVPITVLLKDEDNHVVHNPGSDLRVVLRSTLGTLSKNAVTVARGHSDSDDEVVLWSRRRGRAAITAAAEGLAGDPEFVTFTLPWLLIPLSVCGGIAGVVVRSPRRRRGLNLLTDLAIGGVLGFVLFGLALFGIPTAVPGLQTETLANLTMNEIGAMLLGFLGGYVGRRYLDTMAMPARPRADVAAV